jgi:hypothetical protein
MTHLIMDHLAALGSNPRRLALTGAPFHGGDAVRNVVAREISAEARKCERFVITDSVLELAVELAEGEPGALAACFDMVRAPADHAIIEWNERHRHCIYRRMDGKDGAPPDLHEVSPRGAILLRPSVLGRVGSTLTPIFFAEPGTLYISPVGFHAEWGNPDAMMEGLTQPGAAPYWKRLGSTSSLDDVARNVTKALLGLHYCDRHKDHWEDLQRIAGYGATCFTYHGGRYFSAATRQADYETLQVLSEASDAAFRQVAGDYRLVLAILAVMQAGSDALEVRETGKRTLASGERRSLSAIAMSHRVVTLRLSARIVRERIAALHAEARSSPRWHTYKATRCFSRKRGNPECSHAWMRPDPERDYHVCVNCDMRSWPRSGGERGDKERGEVRKTYMVTA